MPAKSSAIAKSDVLGANPESVTKVGNLTKDPELRFGSEKGTPFTSFGLAVNTPKVPGQWSGDQRTEFYDVVCFGTLAEHAAESLSKGARVVVTGRAEVDRYQSEDGIQRERKRIVAEALGPDLRWATVDVHRSASSKTAGSASASNEGEF
jgi:single-strand DNA-binding protein